MMMEQGHENVEEIHSPSLAEDLASLLNHHSAENESDTPDFLLAEYLVGCLAVYAQATQKRDKWYGIKPEPGWEYPGELEARG